MKSPLQNEFDYYIENQDKLVREHNGKFVVIKNRAVIGVFKTAAEAIEKTQETHELGTFLVQKVAPGSASYTQTFHSRVVFH